MQGRYYPSLDGLRGIAVIIVMLAHAGVPGIRSGGIGVDIFFTLSGFLITSILLKEQDRYGSISIKNFYIRRFLRLLPCLWVVVSAYLVYVYLVRGLQDSGPLKESTYALAYVMNWVRSRGYGAEWPLGHTWSLAIEEQYYFLWPWLIMALGRSGLKHRQLGWLLALAAGVIALYRACLVGYFSPMRIYFGLDTHADGLVCGSALAYFVADLSGQRLSATWSRFIGYVAVPCALAGFGIAACWTWLDPQMGLYGYALVAASSSVIILDLVVGGHSVLRRSLTFGPLVWIGQVSYGLYLWHFPIYDVVQTFASGYGATLLVGGTITFIVAAASYYLVEKRCLMLKDRFSRSGATITRMPESESAAMALAQKETA